MPESGPLPGFTVRVASGSIPVLRLHYTADPAKRPGTPEGDAWLQQAAAGYPGGVQSGRWKKEMEIEYDALGGTPVFPDWSTRIKPAVVVGGVAVAGWRLYGAYDHGWRRPACYLVGGVGPAGQKAILWEFYASRVPVAAIAQILRGHDTRLPDGREWTGNPFAGREVWRRADPELWAENQDTAEFKTTEALFRKHGVVFREGDRGGDLTIVEWLYGAEWANLERPNLLITSACPNLIRELSGLRHKDWSPHVALHRGLQEGIVDKDCDAWDAFKYFLQAFPPGPTPAKDVEAGNTFAWWRKQAKAAKEGRPVQTYARQMVQ
jgi:hypothetical protein